MKNSCNIQLLPTVFDCSLYQLEKNHEEQGNLTYVYNGIHIPFDVKRVFYSYDIPGGEARGLMPIKNVINFWLLRVVVLKSYWMMV